MKSLRMALAAALCACSFGLSAQETEIETAPIADNSKIKIDFDVRADFLRQNFHGQPVEEGFHGRYLNMYVNGTVTEGLTYSWRQRLNKFKDLGNDVFSATDWLFLRYQFANNFAVSAGKEVVLIGGYEYDAPPIDVFYASMFWNNISCFQFGATAEYITDNKNHTFSFQVTNSPFQGINSRCFAYNIFWNGHMGVLNTLWSANMIEYAPGRYVNYISLGNMLSLGKLNLQIDFMNRATTHQKFFFHDFTAICRAEYSFSKVVSLIGKGGYEHYRPSFSSQATIDKPYYGVGVEVFPLKKVGKNLRLHAYWDVNHGDNGIWTNQLNVGVKWRVNVLDNK